MPSDKDQGSALAGFQPTRVLNNDPFTGMVALLGRFADRTEDAVVVIARQQLDPNALNAEFFSKISTDLNFDNDIYRKYAAIPPAEQAKLNIDVILPATERHISKHSSQKLHVVHESPELYGTITKQYIESIPAERLKWVHNILDGSAELERRLFHDTDEAVGFVLLPDMKWDQSNMEQLYCVAICNRSDVKSMRDLSTEHLPLLENIRDKGQQVLGERFGISPDQLRIFVHYQPSYYHFHVHFASLKVMSATVAAGKAYLLDDVIDNITHWHDYYQKRTLTLVLGENDELQKLLLGQNKKRKAAADPQA